MNDQNFYTLKGYELLEAKKITYAMEDYLEMICRLCLSQESVRIQQLSQKLNVKPSSASKMTNNLKSLGLVEFKKYGYIKPTPCGYDLGSYLIERHNILHDFLCMVNQSDNELTQVEKVEHYLDAKTVANIKAFCQKDKDIYF